MREILFRGKRNKDGEWVQGWFIGKTRNEPYKLPRKKYTIVDENLIAHYIVPSTICQFTGLTDKNGNKVFEGDIVYCSVWEDYFEVQIKEGHFALVKDNNTDFSYFEEKMKYIEVVGNIYDIKDEAKEVIKALQENSKTITTLIEKTIDGLQQIKNNINNGIKNFTENKETTKENEELFSRAKEEVMRGLYNEKR